MAPLPIRFLFAAVGAIVLAGCDQVDKFMFSQMEQEVVVAAKPLQLGPKPITLTPDPALQVRGLAGEHQIEGAHRALGHAYGGAAQYFAMWVVGSEMP